MTVTYSNSGGVCLISQAFIAAARGKKTANVNYSYFYNCHLFATRNIQLELTVQAVTR